MVLQRPLTRIFTLVAVLAVLGGVGAANAAAQEASASFSLKPVSYDPDTPRSESYIIQEVRPGETIETEVRVLNNGDASGVARLLTVDAMTGQTSGVVYGQNDVEAEHVGSWTTTSDATVELAAGAEQTVGVTIEVPGDVRAGHHVGAIVVGLDSPAESATPVDDGEDEAAVRVQMETRMAMAVQLTVLGNTTEGMEVTGFEPGGSRGHQSLEIAMQNTGNLMLKPQGELQVRDAAGATVQEIEFQLDTVLPDTAIDYPVRVQDEALAPGDYEATVVLTYGDGEEFSFTDSFEITDDDIAQVFGGDDPLDPPETSSGDSEESGSGNMATTLGLVAFGSLAVLGMLGFAGFRRRSHG